MLCCPHHKGWNCFEIEVAKLQEKELYVDSNSNTFQRNYENFSENFNSVDLLEN